MTQAEALRLAAYIAGAYRNSDSSNGALAVLADQLTDLDHTKARDVVRGIVATGKPFAPAPGEIREAYFAAVYNIPTVAAIVYEVAERAGSELTKGRWSHPFIREVALEVGGERLRTDWNFAHREVGEVAERLRGEVLRKLNLASLYGTKPELPRDLALAVHGLDQYEMPKLPDIPEGWVFEGWDRFQDAPQWTGTARSRKSNGLNPPDSRRYSVGLMYENFDPDMLTLPPGKDGRPALPPGAWKPPEPTYEDRRYRYADPALAPPPKPWTPKVRPSGAKGEPKSIGDALDPFLDEMLKRSKPPETPHAPNHNEKE